MCQAEMVSGLYIILLYTILECRNFSISGNVLINNLQESISTLARQFKTNKKTSHREKYKVAQGIHERLKQVVEDVRESKIVCLNYLNITKSVSLIIIII